MGSTTHKKLISVVVPLCNEEDGIDQLNEKLNRLQQAFEGEARLEFVLVDDGSTDRTRERLQATFGDREDCHIISHARNCGIGAAFRTGFSHSQGSIVCTIDADCSYEPEGVKRLVESMEATGADVALASPYHPEGQVEGVPHWRIVISKACSLLYRVLSPVRLYTYTSIFRAYRRRVIETVRFDADGFVSATEIVMRAGEQGYRFVEIPMTLRARKAGTTKMKVVRTIFTHLRMLAGVVKRRATRFTKRSRTRHRSVSEISNSALGKANTAIGVHFSAAGKKE